MHKRIREIKRVIHGATGVTKSVTGISLASEEEIKRRRKICSNCEFALKYKQSTTRVHKCSACGCILRHKTRLKNESCPKNKW